MARIRITEEQMKLIVESIIDSQNPVGQDDDLKVLLKYLSHEHDTDIRNGGKPVLNAKAYNYFIPRGIVRNAWALHFTYTEAWEKIMRDGFRNGCTNLDSLAYSNSAFDENGVCASLKNDGWNFALPIDNPYLGEDCGYGDCAFLIQTDGVRAHHIIDGDDEILFKNKYVKRKIPFCYEEDYDGWNPLGSVSRRIMKSGKMPQGAYYEDEIEGVLFSDVKSLINYLITGK